MGSLSVRMLVVPRGEPSLCFCMFRGEGSWCAARVTAIADKLGLDFALIHKKRGVRGAEAPEQMELLVGDVRGKV